MVVEVGEVDVFRLGVGVGDGGAGGFGEGEDVLADFAEGFLRADLPGHAKIGQSDFASDGLGFHASDSPASRTSHA